MRTIIIKGLLGYALLSVFALLAQACETCLDFGTIESREECKSCVGTGKHWESSNVACTTCGGTGRDTYKLQGIHYGSYKTVNCRKCAGTGLIVVKNWTPCSQCAGKGVLVTRVTCPTCKGKSVAKQEGGGEKLVSTQEGGGDKPVVKQEGGAGQSAVKMVAVETCNRCDSEGKTSTVVLCARCEKGYLHKKDGEKFICRKCGKVCKDRFSPCECGQPDCQICNGEYKKIIKKICDVCGGDKIITPMEREKLIEREKLKN